METKSISSSRLYAGLLLLSVTAAGMTLLASLAAADAQQPPPPPPPATSGYQQPTASSLQGTVVQYLTNPRGDVDGLLLGDNTVVRFPPHLGAQLVQVVAPQSTVKVDGYSAFAGTIRATTITNTATSQAVTDTPPAPGNPPPPPPFSAETRQQINASGTIKALTHAPRGEIDGAVLSDGTVIHFGPDNGAQFANLLVLGQPFAATGFGSVNQYGKSLEAIAVGASASELQSVVAGRGHPRGPGAPPPPPVPGAPVPPPVQSQ